MQHIIQEIVDTLQDFIADEEQSVMLIEAQAEEAPLLLKTFGMVEEDELSPDVFLSFADDFQDTRRYVEMIIERQREQIEAVNEELAKIGQPPLEQLPGELSERNKPSQIRLLELFEHTRRTVEAERQIIWIFYPLTDVETEKEDFFVNLFEDIAVKIMNGDLGNTKLIIRDTPSQSLRTKLGCETEKENEYTKNPKVLCYRPEVDFQSVLKKIEDQAKNKQLPPEERVQSVMLMAGVDVAEKRYDEALSKNQQVLKHYQKTKQKQNESVVQNNIGDIYYLQGDYPTAQKSYENAINIAVAEKSQPLVIYQGINLGNSLFMQKNYDEALVYYDSSEKLADVNQVLPQRVQALERIGDTKRAQGNLDEAIEVYEKTADLCRENKYDFGLYGVLERLCEVYAEKKDQEKHDKCADELAEVKKKLEEIDPHLVEK
jgi:tetratricopeptide (TPR) repeat protein